MRPKLLSPGLYLVCLVPNQQNLVQIGRLGGMRLDGGVLLYVGSAYGRGGLAARCRHHLRIARRPHWHLDALRPYCQVLGCWMASRPREDEHRWARLLGNLPGATYPFPRFGASDCRCPAHLVRLGQMPETSALSALLGAELIWQPADALDPSSVG